MELLQTLATAYPGWTLFFLFALCLALIEAIPASIRALRGAPVQCSCKEEREAEDASDGQRVGD